jgi:hypothetical protein
MKVSNYDGEQELEDINSLQIIIKSVPYENSYVPAFVIMSPTDTYPMTINELNTLMDGIEIAKSKIDEIINYILRKKVFKEEPEDDIGTSD